MMNQPDSPLHAVDMGDNAPMETIRIEHLRLWVAVRAVVNRDGRTFYDPL